MQPEGTLNPSGIHVPLRIERRRHNRAHNTIPQNRRPKRKGEGQPGQNAVRFPVRLKSHPENHGRDGKNEQNRPVHPLIQRIGQRVIKGQKDGFHRAEPLCLSPADPVSRRKAAYGKAGKKKSHRDKEPQGEIPPEAQMPVPQLPAG